MYNVIKSFLIFLINKNIFYKLKLSNSKDLKDETIDELFTILIKSLQLLDGDLKKVLVDKITEEIRLKYLNTLKMATYLIVELSTFVEKKVCKETNSDLLSQSTAKV